MRLKFMFLSLLLVAMVVVLLQISPWLERSQVVRNDPLQKHRDAVQGASEARMSEKKTNDASLGQKNAQDCWQEYLATIDASKNTDYVPGKSVMMDKPSVRVMCDTLADFDAADVLEWGCGGSTLFFSRFAKRWHSIEHDMEWGRQFERDLKEKNLLEPAGVVSLDLIPPDKPFLSHEDGTAEQFHTYCGRPGASSHAKKYDMILVDGRARVACALAVLRDDLLKDERSVVVIHDFERTEYHDVFKYFDPIKWERTGPRHLVVLKPKPHHPPLPDAVANGGEATSEATPPKQPSCWDEYLRTIDVSRGVDYVPGKTVMMDRKSVRVMCGVLSSFAGRKPDVLEWGCGGSTLFFSRFAHSWHSVEHDTEWGHQFERDLRAKGLLAPHGAVKLELVPPDKPFPPKEDGTLEQFAAYCGAPGAARGGEKKYDVVLVDGRARVGCALAVLRDKLLRDETSVVVMHDFERREYHAVFEYYDAVEWERTEPRHIVVLRPKPDRPPLPGEAPPP